jgi:hypothetical protein
LGCAEGGSSGLGPPRTSAAAAVVVSAVVVSVVFATKPATAASRPASAAEAEAASNGLARPARPRRQPPRLALGWPFAPARRCFVRRCRGRCPGPAPRSACGNPLSPWWCQCLRLPSPPWAASPPIGVRVESCVFPSLGPPLVFCCSCRCFRQRARVISTSSVVERDVLRKMVLLSQ